MMSPAPNASPVATHRREQVLASLVHPDVHDLIVIGGGATGLGVALDAAARGLKVVLLESHDFGKGTSSRATKLLHGGVRYLAQGNLSLVREALHERTTLLRNAPHLAQPLPFLMPSYRFWEKTFYGIGLRLYDLLAGASGLGPTTTLGREAVQRLMPNLRRQGLRGGVRYWDAQFDDARLAIALARTAAAHGALLLNYCAVTGLIHEQGRVVGVQAEDRETGSALQVRARCVINAAGVWVDRIRAMEGPLDARAAQPMVAASQGVHLVVDRHFLTGDHALIVPRTTDGRVLFAVPWLGKVILGTTDTPRQDLAREPKAFEEEIAFILGEAGRYLSSAPQRSDVRSIWVGLRPLVKPQARQPGESTKALSREHTVVTSSTGLVTVTGGKWTTYRAMAEDVLSHCVSRGLLPARVADTSTLMLQGAPARSVGLPPEAGGLAPVSLSAPPGLHLYGQEAVLLQGLPGADHLIAPGLSEAMVRFAVRHEFARTVEDVLARRSRLLFLDAAAAIQAVPAVAAILSQELGGEHGTRAGDHGRQAFEALAAGYLLEGRSGPGTLQPVAVR